MWVNIPYVDPVGKYTILGSCGEDPKINCSMVPSMANVGIDVFNQG